MHILPNMWHNWEFVKRSFNDVYDKTSVVDQTNLIYLCWHIPNTKQQTKDKRRWTLLNYTWVLDSCVCFLNLGEPPRLSNSKTEWTYSTTSILMVTHTLRIHRSTNAKLSSVVISMTDGITAKFCSKVCSFLISQAQKL